MVLEIIRRRRAVQVVLGLAVVLVVLDLGYPGFSEEVAKHQLTAGFIAEAILLALIYLLFDELVARREANRWQPVALAGLDTVSRVGNVLTPLNAFYSGWGRDHERPVFGSSSQDDRRAFLLQFARDKPAVAKVEELVKERIEEFQTSLEGWLPVLLTRPDLSGVMNEATTLLTKTGRLRGLLKRLPQQERRIFRADGTEAREPLDLTENVELLLAAWDEYQEQWWSWRRGIASELEQGE
jgi:hypothetical protein